MAILVWVTPNSGAALSPSSTGAVRVDATSDGSSFSGGVRPQGAGSPVLLNEARLQTRFVSDANREERSRGLPWPVPHPRVVAGARIPDAPWLPGHRGVDVATESGSTVTSPLSGWVRFAGAVAGRPVISLERSDGLIVTLEPVTARFTAGTSIGSGEAIGVVAHGGHCDQRCIHIGVIRAGTYLSPLTVFAPWRARLLPNDPPQ